MVATQSTSQGPQSSNNNTNAESDASTVVEDQDSDSDSDSDDEGAMNLTQTSIVLRAQPETPGLGPAGEFNHNTHSRRALTRFQRDISNFKANRVGFDLKPSQP